MAKQMDHLSRLRKIGQEGFDLLDSLKGPRARRAPQPCPPPPPPTYPRVHQYVHHHQHNYPQAHTYYVAEPQTWPAARNETLHHFQVQEQHTTPTTTITSDQAAGYYDGFSVVDHGRTARPSRYA